LTLTQPVNGGGAGLGNAITPLVFTNKGTGACSRTGYPGLALLDASGHTLTNTITRSTSSYLLSTREVEPVVLTPGNGAAFFLSYRDGPIGNQTSCPDALQARAIPPDDTQSIAARVAIEPCGDILLSPVVASADLG